MNSPKSEEGNPIATLRRRISSLEKSLGKGDTNYALQAAKLLEDGVPSGQVRGVYDYFRARVDTEGTGKPGGKASKEVADLLYRAMYKEQTQQ